MDALCFNEKENECSFDFLGTISKRNPSLKNLTKFILYEKDSILYRQEIFRDIFESTALLDFFSQLFDKIDALSFFKTQEKLHDNNERLYNTLIYPKYYLELVDYINTERSKFNFDNIHSNVIKSLFDMGKDDYSNDNYKYLKEYFNKNSEKLLNIKSISIGVNLTPDLKPKEAGLTGIYSQEYKSGSILDRVIRMEFKNSDFFTLAPLTCISKKLGFEESQRLNQSILNSLDKVFNSSLLHCKSHIIKYLKGRLDKYFVFLSNFDFLINSINYIKDVKELNIPIFFPKISSDSSFEIKSLYNYQLVKTQKKGTIVPSDVYFLNSKKCYLLSGPNSAGKTIYLESIATAQFLFQLGLPIPAIYAKMPICDRVCMFSAQEIENNTKKGRFETECDIMSKINDIVTEKTLVLIDELFTSTSVIEASEITAGLLNVLSPKTLKCIIITHMDLLYEKLSNYASISGIIDYLHTEENNGVRSYKVVNGKWNFKNDAYYIARKYGLN